jgi:hypothetical protein
MTREEYYELPCPSGTYKDLGTGNSVLLPRTKAQFEELLSEVVKRAGLHEVDDDMRQVLNGWVHHIPNDKCEVTMGELITVINKSVSNVLTWRMDQDIKAKKAQEAKDAADKLKSEQENVINMPPRGTPGMDAKS